MCVNACLYVKNLWLLQFSCCCKRRPEIKIQLVNPGSVMVARGQTFDREEELLRADSRWALIERILESEEFRRAAQLRKILRYACKVAILRPHKGLSEVEV